MIRRALVVGCAACVWEDVDRATRLCEYDAVYCVKQIGIYWPGKFDVWVTLHPEWMNDYERQRHDRGLPDGYEIVAPPAEEVGMHGEKGRVARRVSYKTPGQETSGSASSGIYGARVALHDGCDKIVLAGVPFTAQAGHFLPKTRNGHGLVRGETWEQRSAFMVGYERELPHLRERVRSVSGYTMETLGFPDSVWLGETSEKSTEQQTEKVT